MGGFAYADTPFNGLTVVVTATDQHAADALAREIAEAGWARREQLPPHPDRAWRKPSALAKATADPAQSHALIFADVADNPGGGGRGNTMGSSRRSTRRRPQRPGRRDPRSRAGRRGAPARRRRRVHRALQPRRRRRILPALHRPRRGRRLLDRPMRGRRGIYANNTLDLGQSAALDLDGITVVVADQPLPVRRPDVLRSVRAATSPPPGSWW